jgi:FkbM family methyltransferase
MTASATFRTRRATYRMEGLGPTDRYLLLVKGRFEARFQDLCAALLRDGDIALDVGANIGATALILAEAVGRGRVVAMEPGPTVFPLLVSNLARNGAANAQALHCAIGAEAARMAFHEESSFGHVQLSGEGMEVDVRTIDEVVETLALPRVDFIKIDTEGFEPHVFAGARGTIERFQPIIYFELNVWTLLANAKADPFLFMEQVLALPADAYRVARVRPDLALEPLDGDVTRSLHDTMAFHGSNADILLVPRGSERAAAIAGLINKPLTLRSRTARIARRIGRALLG